MNNIKRLTEVEAENQRLCGRLLERDLEISAIKEINSRSSEHANPTRAGGVGLLVRVVRAAL